MKSLLLLLLATLCAFSGYGQTIKTLGFNSTNGQVIANTTNTLTFTNEAAFSGIYVSTIKNSAGDIVFDVESPNLGIGTNAIIEWNNSEVQVTKPILFFGSNTAATTRTNLGLPLPALTNNNVTNFRTAIGLGATNSVVFDSLALKGLPIGSGSGFIGHSSGAIQIKGTNVSTGTPAFFGWDGFNSTAIDVATARTNLGLGATNSVTFSNLTLNGTLTAASIATSTPVSWSLDAIQTAAATNGVLDLPLNANVLRITNANTISAITNGRLGAFYFLLNQSGTNLVISNSATITARGATNLTLGANQSATLISTTATNATVH